MYTPDSRIVELVKNYDQDLFIKWNHHPRAKYFEVWRRKTVGSILITPVTKSIYNVEEKKEFIPLDERIIWWLHGADSWRVGGAKKQAFETDRRWREWEKNKKVVAKVDRRNMAKDMWTAGRSFYTTKHKSKNSRLPNFHKSKGLTSFIRPDVAATGSKRIFSRSHANAKAHNFQGD